MKAQTYYLTEGVIKLLDSYTKQQKKADPRMSKSVIVEKAIMDYIDK